MACGCNGMPKVKPTGAPCGCRSKSLPRSRLLEDVADVPVLTLDDIEREQSENESRRASQARTLAEVLKATDYPPPRGLLARIGVGRSEAPDCGGATDFEALKPTRVTSPLASGVGKVIRETGFGIDRHNLRLQVLSPLWELTGITGPQSPEAAGVACDPCEPGLATLATRATCASQVGPDDSKSEDFEEPPQQQEPESAARDGCQLDPCASSSLFGAQPLYKTAEMGPSVGPSCPSHEVEGSMMPPVEPVRPDIRGKAGHKSPCPCTCVCAIWLPWFGHVEPPVFVEGVVDGLVGLWERRSHSLPDLLWLLRSTGFRTDLLAPRASSRPGSDEGALLAGIGTGFVPSLSPLVEGGDFGLGRFTGLDLTALRPMASEPSESTLDREERVTFVSSSHPGVPVRVRVPFSSPLSDHVREGVDFLVGIDAFSPPSAVPEIMEEVPR